jgi:hypothetical protein
MPLMSLSEPLLYFSFEVTLFDTTRNLSLKHLRQVDSLGLNIFRIKIFGVSDNTEPQLCLLHTFVECFPFRFWGSYNCGYGEFSGYNIVILWYTADVLEEKIAYIFSVEEWALLYFQRNAKRCIPGSMILHSVPYFR